jgi:hypothetical protein
MKEIKEIIEWIEDEIESENSYLEDDHSPSSHMATASMASRDTMVRLLEFIKEGGNELSRKDQATTQRLL